MDSTSPRRQLAPVAGKRAAPEESPENAKQRKATASGSPKKGKNAPHTQTAAYKKTTDPRKVDWLVISIVSKNLTNTWKVNNSHKMCFIFDYVNPTCLLAWDMYYNKDIEFPDADARGGNVTD